MTFTAETAQTKEGQTPLFLWTRARAVAVSARLKRYEMRVEVYPIGAPRHFPYKGKLSNALLSAYAGITPDIGPLYRGAVVSDA